jgi:hypothetical protein
MRRAIHKSTYADGQAYEYQITDPAGEPRLRAEHTGALLPDPSRLVTIFDSDEQRVARVEPHPFSEWWWTRGYTLKVIQEPRATIRIEECWTTADRILLQLPTYLLHLEDETYIARGRRYGELFYELFLPPVKGGPPDDLAPMEQPEMLNTASQDQEENQGEKVGEIRRLPSGASYVVDLPSSIAQRTLLTASVLTILADMHFQEHSEDR